MKRIEAFERAQKRVRSLDHHGHDNESPSMFRQYQQRNSFGLDRNQRIHRIFQRQFLDQDMADQCLTLPNATASIWKDDLENPLSTVHAVDPVTGLGIDLGRLTGSFFALCWTQKPDPTSSDWGNFSHGGPAVRVSTTVGKLMDRTMFVGDASYMHRVWLIEAIYEDSSEIVRMRNPGGVYARLESQGALLALSAATVRSCHSAEDEIRLLFDGSVQPLPSGATELTEPRRIRIPFNWQGFVDRQVSVP